MLDISKSQRHFILTLIISSLFFLSTSYCQKNNPDTEIINMDLYESRTLIDINTATAIEFEYLPGIGSVIARDIVRYRKRTGRFKRIEELKNVKGIGNKKFERIKNTIIIK